MLYFHTFRSLLLVAQANQDTAHACLQGFVRIAVDQFLAGTDLYRLQLQQSMAGGLCRSGAWVCFVVSLV